MIKFRHNSVNRYGRVLAAGIVAVAALAGCRGGDGTDGVDPDIADFVDTPDPDRFIQYLNIEPGVPGSGVADGAIDNFNDFPTAYYNTIDPNATRATFDDWKVENGFLQRSGETLVEPACDAVENCCVPQMPVTAQCKVVSTQVMFRDTKDLGYGRDMHMRHTRLGDNSGQVAIFVRNFKVDSIEGLPYGPLNLEALVEGDNHWQFGVNAIEFSTYPYGDGEPSSSVVDNHPECVADATSASCLALANRKFAKFYNFAGDGRVDAGARQRLADLDERGARPMPTSCLTCHGARGTTVVNRAADGTLGLEPTLHNELPGDVQAQLQTIETDTLQFSSAIGFRREDNEAGLRAINEAILASYREHEQFLLNRTAANSGYWDPSFAISLLEGRLADGSSFDRTHVPADWQSQSTELYTEFVGPHCHTCHALQGSQINGALSFSSATTMQNFSSRIDHLVFEKGLMPLGLWSYREFWDLKEPVSFAESLGLNDRVQADETIRPGAPVARISAPLVEAATAGTIRVSGSGSAFADTYEWSVSPANATITGNGSSADITLPASPDSEYTVTLRVSNSRLSCQTGNACEQSVTIALNQVEPLQANFCASGGVNELIQNNCGSCHSPLTPLNPAMPVVYPDACDGAIDADTASVRYRNLLTRVDLSSPLDSLLLRKPTNGATRIDAVSESAIVGYHGGGVLFSNNEAGQRNISTLINWINRGAEY
jgi:mono/diheme cytochrome c family protein